MLCVLRPLSNSYWKMFTVNAVFKHLCVSVFLSGVPRAAVEDKERAPQSVY